jgi:tRNA A37 threonylcarbamoyladenosine synthetase subunit TsaC/SUA5/YrdC
MDKNIIYLAQCDSTVGFLCNDEIKLNKIKHREQNTKNILAIKSFKVLKNLQESKQNQVCRVPNKYKNLIRRAKKTSFIIKNFSFRIINKENNHFNFINKFDYIYSSSANLHKQKFNFKTAYELCNVCVYSSFNMKECKSSSIIKLFVNKKVIVR